MKREGQDSIYSILINSSSNVICLKKNLFVLSAKEDLTRAKMKKMGVYEYQQWIKSYVILKSMCFVVLFCLVQV
jgi:hypothetical protein